MTRPRRDARMVANFARHLKQYLAFAGITQTELARRLGVTPAAISAWSTASKLPDLEMAARLARLTHTHAEDWISDEGPTLRLSDLPTGRVRSSPR